jgi:hypothetical protein
VENEQYGTANATYKLEQAGILGLAKWPIEPKDTNKYESYADYLYARSLIPSNQFSLSSLQVFNSENFNFTATYGAFNKSAKNMGDMVQKNNVFGERYYFVKSSGM